jgi:hypothetical protein
MVKEKIEGGLRMFPNVHAVGIGEKYVDGKGTGETSIAVLVLEKKALEQLKPEELVPPEIEGIKTDVIQVPMPRLLMPGNPNNLAVGFTDSTFTGIKFSGVDKPGASLLVRVEFTGTPTTADPPNFAITYETSDDDTLSSIASYCDPRRRRDSRSERDNQQQQRRGHRDGCLSDERHDQADRCGRGGN